MKHDIRLTIPALFLVIVGGCAGSRQLAPVPSAQFPPVYAPPGIYAFEVRDAEGISIDHPFLGGFNVPRPQLVDIDADGDLDVFVQELTGHLIHFENVGTAKQPDFRWRSDQYQNLDVGEWYRFVDFDSDGDFDILGELPNSYLRLFLNSGTPSAPTFTTTIDSLRDADGVPLFADAQNIPSLVDLDCDDLLDLFVGRVDGTVRRYESVGNDAQGIPRMRMVTERFEDIQIVAQFGGMRGAGTLHGANALTFHDVDDDGDPDLFWGDFFEPGVLLIPNTGTCEAPNLRNDPIPFPLENPVLTSGYNATAFADLNGDNRADFFIGVLGGAFQPARTSATNLFYLEATPEGFELRTRQFISQIDVGSESIPTFADLDGDGDQDLLLSNKIAQDELKTAHIHVFENHSGSAGTSFQYIGKLPLSGLFHYAPSLADLDGDDDLDMLVGTWNDGVHFYRNNGDAQRHDFAAEEALNISLTRGSNGTPALVDIDTDGDYDLFIGESSGELNFYRNHGSPTDPRFELVSDNFDDIDAGRRSTPAFTDLDGDGDQDMILGNESGEALIYLNVGTPEAPAFEGSGTLSIALPYYAALAFVDLDGDGVVDLFSGGMGGGLRYYQRIP